ADLPSLHHAGDPTAGNGHESRTDIVPGPGTKSGSPAEEQRENSDKPSTNQAREQSGVVISPGQEPIVEPRDRSRQASSVGDPSSTRPSVHDAQRQDLKREGWVPIRHVGSSVIRDVQRESPGMMDDEHISESPVDRATDLNAEPEPDSNPS